MNLKVADVFYLQIDCAHDKYAVEPLTKRNIDIDPPVELIISLVGNLRIA